MSEDTGQERSHDASDKRIADARKKGDVARSRELNTVLMLLASMIGLAVLGRQSVSAYKELTKKQWTIDRELMFSDAGVLNALLWMASQSMMIIAPILLLMLVAAFVGPLCMGGWVFSTTLLKPDFKKVNPFSGIKRILGVQGLMELFKAVLKVVVLASIAVILARTYTDDYLQLSVLPLHDAVNRLFAIIFVIILILVLSLSVVAIVDVPYQRWSYAKKLRMTTQEVREENKETSGNPEVKAKVRQLQQANANRKMLLDVPDADVIITNPTHFSVALRYNEDQVAPVVVAKGVDHMAMKIREIAEHHDVELFCAPPLARALYRHADVGETIPSELYLAVAQVLAYVLQVKAASFRERRHLKPPSDLPVPDDLLDSDHA